MFSAWLAMNVFGSLRISHYEPGSYRAAHETGFAKRCGWGTPGVESFVHWQPSPWMRSRTCARHAVAILVWLISTGRPVDVVARVITPGRYSVWFRTPVGEGAGVVEFGADGTLTGGDSTFACAGNWTQQGEHFKASLSARRVAPGPPGVFGLDEIDILVAGRSVDGSSTVCTGFARQAPGLRLEVELVRIHGDHSEGV